MRLPDLTASGLIYPRRPHAAQEDPGDGHPSLGPDPPQADA